MMANMKDLKPDKRNARKHTPRNQGMIEHSIQTNGFGRSVLLASDGSIIAGNATIDAASSAGLDDVLIVESDGTRVIAVKRTDVAPGSERFHALAIADNRAAELAEWDASVLEELSGEIDLSAFFFDEELQSIIDGDTTLTAGLTDPDDVPDVPAEPATKPGDLWQLGRHRLLCGDSTVVTDVDRLMGGAKADMVFTDPPYGIDVVSGSIGGSKPYGTADSGGSNIVKANQYAPIIGDQTTDTAREAYHVCHALGFTSMVIWGGNYFTDFLPPRKCWIVWDKKGREWDDNFSDFEMAWTSFEKPAKIFRHTWMGIVQEGDREKRVHPTQKPVALALSILDYLDAKNVVLDLFGGSGSTLLACEQSNRTCYMSELSPAYCDVIIRRWEQFTGQTATLQAVT